MTKQEILEYFKDINHAYNESTRLDDLSHMLDELIQSNSDEDYISRKALLEEIENGIKAGNYEEGYEEYPHINNMNDIIECIKYADSIQPKPKTDVLDKIRAEIEQKKSDILSDTLSDMDCGIITGLEWAIEFIDKYKAESEPQESKETDI